jgi:site-specific DNA-methyltransferase (adenine-specific)
MKPYFEENKTTIYQGNCLEVLPLLSPDMAIVTDSPYGMSANFERQGLRRKSTLGGYGQQYHGWKSIEGDGESFDPAHLLNYPIVALFGANHFADKLPPEIPGKQFKWLFWDKRNGSPPDNNSDGELIWTNQIGALRVHSQKWRGIVREGEENLAIQGVKLHPAQKPVSLMRWVIGQLKIPAGTVICDPYMGSGSSLVAAKQLGYRSIGIELSADYCAAAVKRLSQGAFNFAEAI